MADIVAHKSGKEIVRNLIIIGAGGFGREVFSCAVDVQSHRRDWEIRGFLDDNPHALDGYHYEAPIIDSIENYLPQDGDCFIIGLQSPQEKLSIGERLLQRGAKFINLIHPTAVVGKNSTLGYGCVICIHSGISCDVQGGNFVTLNAHGAVGHDAILGDGCTISAFAHVSGLVTLGKGAYVGIHGCILPKVKVGDFATIGAGSVVLKHVKPGSTVLGVPAKLIL